MTKTCSICKQPKDFESFDKDKRAKYSGRMSACKKCRSDNYEANFEIRASDVDYRLRHALAYSKRKKIPFKLTKEEYEVLIAMPCHYCEQNRITVGIWLDRINNDKSIGYAPNNVLPCCSSCNRIRSDILTVEETQIAIKAVLELRKSKNM